MDFARKIMRYKMILFGNEGVGKTSLVERFANNRYNENYISTLGYNVFEKNIVYHGSIIISLMIYDIGGQERFTKLRRKYAEGANTAFIVFDITDSNSFLNLLKWKNDLMEFAGSIPFVIIGNKIDLQTHRQVARDDALKMCTLLGALAYYETSAKNGKGVEDAFFQLAVVTYNSYSSGIITA